MTFANPDVLAFYKTLPFNFRRIRCKQCGSNSISGPASAPTLSFDPYCSPTLGC